MSNSPVHHLHVPDVVKARALKFLHVIASALRSLNANGASSLNLILLPRPLALTMIIAKRAYIQARTCTRLKRSLSSRASGILSAFNILANKEVDGVYDGQWKGSGEVVESKCPTTGASEWTTVGKELNACSRGSLGSCQNGVACRGVGSFGKDPRGLSPLP